MSKILPLPSFSYLNECFSYDNKGLPEGLEYDRERIMWGSRYIGWYRTKTQAIEWLYSLSAV